MAKTPPKKKKIAIKKKIVKPKIKKMSVVEPTKTTEAEVTEEVKGKLKFGIAGLNSPTPKWATFIFRTEFIISKFIVIWLTSTSLIHNENVLKETLLIITIVDAAVWTAARFIGVKKEDLETVN